MESRHENCGYGTYPCYSGGPVPSGLVGDGALILDEDDAFISNNTESEGDFGVGGNADDDDDDDEGD